MSQPGTGRMPRQIPYIIANEGCERFSFYGMRNILTPFLISSLLLFLPEADRASDAKHVFHTFVIGVYFFPLLGGFLADRFFGKYNTVFWLSLVYCAGHACLAAFDDNLHGFYVGLFLIALGSGGIKPLVSSFVGDQFDQTNKHKAKLVYDAFYWIINFGSFFASLLMPIFLRDYGPSVAFGIPGILMFIATIVFWSGRRKYVHVPPAPPNPHSFTRVAQTALFAGLPGQGRPGLAFAVLGAAGAVAALAMAWSWGFVIAACTALVVLLAFGGIGIHLQLDRARGVHPDDAVDGVQAVLRILVVFALVTPFWSLFDQKASTWIVQANAMTHPTMSIFGSDFTFVPAQMQALNPMLVMLLIPFNNLVLYPALRRFGYEPTALRRMTFGIVFTALAWGRDRRNPGGDGCRHTHVDGVADPAVCDPDAGRSAGLGHRPGIRVQPVATVDEGCHHGVLEPGRHRWQPVSPDRQRQCQERCRAGPHRIDGTGRDVVPDVLLCRLRVRGGAGVRPVCAQLQTGR